MSKSKGQDKDDSKGEKTPPLDFSKRQQLDPRDPRVSDSCWPCLGSHRPSAMKSNQYAGWKECEKCALRLEYVPREACTGKYEQKVNPDVVAAAMQSLKQHCEESGVPPTTKLAKAMIQKVEAEIKLSQSSSLTKKEKISATRVLEKVSSRSSLETPKGPPETSGRRILGQKYQFQRRRKSSSQF